jgi:nuclear GTP-binding protein
MPRGKSVRGVRGDKGGSGPRQKKGQSEVKTNRAGGTVNISAKPRHVQDANRVSDSKQAAGSNERSKQTVNRINMYRSSALKWQHGKLVGKGLVSDAVAKNKPARVAPDRRWFGNTRVVGQKELANFREEIAAKEHDPYTVLLKRKQLPMGLLTDATKMKQMKLLEVESYSDTFGGKSKRKRPKIGAAATSLEALVAGATSKTESYQPTKDSNIRTEWEAAQHKGESHLFDKGQSKRIWGELYKVIDCSDVVIQVLDARDPMGTRSKHIERHLQKNASHKHLVLVLNKCDLVPTWSTRRWVQKLSKEYPTLAFHASLTNSFGKGALINLLRQFSQLHKDKKSISIGLIGYPNVGKSSIINTLKGKKTCNVAPIPGETKIWQYVTLMRRVFLVDCPGVVYHHTEDNEGDSVLKGVVRVESLMEPQEFAYLVIARVKRQYLERTYKVEWKSENPDDFLEAMAQRFGKLMKGGEPDTVATSKMILNDWQRGKIPWFQPPPFEDDDKKEGEEDGAATEGGGEEAAGAEVDEDGEPVAEKFNPEVAAQKFGKAEQQHSYDAEGDILEDDDEEEKEAGLIDWDDVYQDDEEMSDDDTIAALPNSTTGDGRQAGSSTAEEGAEDGNGSADSDDGGDEGDSADADALMRSVAASSTPSEIGEARPAKKRKKEKTQQQEDDRPFVAFKKFAGAKHGYVFKNGENGVGYYKDTPPVPKVSASGGKKGKKGKKGGAGNGSGRGHKKRERQLLKKQLKEEQRGRMGGLDNRVTKGGEKIKAGRL